MINVKIKIVLASIQNKIKKFFDPHFDVYGKRPNALLLSPSHRISKSKTPEKRALSFSSNLESPEIWLKTARKKLIELSGYSEERPKPKVSFALDPVKIGTQITKHTFYLRVNMESDVPVHLLFKNNTETKVPVFIFLAGSTSGVHVGWGEAKVPIDHERIHFGSDMLLQAAKQGYLGVGIEQAGYGERREMDLKKKSLNRTVDTFSHLLLQGKSLVGLGTSDVSSVIDWLISKSCSFDIDLKNIYLFGHSSGGTLAQYCGAIDKRISGVMASGSVGQIQSTILQRGSPGGEGVVPEMLKWFESADVLAMHSPRPFVALSGRNDHIFPYEGAKKVVEEARKFYQSMSASSNIHAVEGPHGHRYYGDLSWNSWRQFVHKQ